MDVIFSKDLYVKEGFDVSLLQEPPPDEGSTPPPPDGDFAPPPPMEPDWEEPSWEEPSFENVSIASVIWGGGKHWDRALYTLSNGRTAFASK